MRKNRSAPSATIVPILVYANVETAIAWLSGLGFTERVRALGPDGRINHAQLDFGEGSVMIGREGGPFRVPDAHDSATHVVHTAVEDVDAHYARTETLGIHILRKPTTMPFGERQYTVVDPEGHWWTFSQHVADLAPEDWGARSMQGVQHAG